MGPGAAIIKPDRSAPAPGLSPVLVRASAILAGLLLIACARPVGPTPTPPPTPMPLPTATQAGRGGLPPGMLPYQDPQGGFFIAYPDTWVVLPGQGSVRFAENALILSEDSPAAGATVFVLTGQVGDIGNAAGRSIRNSRDLLDYVLEGLKAEHPPSDGIRRLPGSNPRRGFPMSSHRLPVGGYGSCAGAVSATSSGTAAGAGVTVRRRTVASARGSTAFAPQ